MKYHFDIIHPANVHYFKGLIKNLESNGHQVLVTARDKDLVYYLLEAFDIGYIKSSKPKSSKFIHRLWFLLRDCWSLVNLYRKEKPDVAISFASASVSWACSLSGVSHIAFDDTEHAALNRRLYLPFTKRVFSPEPYLLDLGEKHFKFRSFMELFYLHPSEFSKLKSEVYLHDTDQPYAVVRYIAWDAFHDNGKKGLSPELKVKILELLSKRMNVMLSVEGTTPPELNAFKASFPPEQLHSILSKCCIYIGEGATTAIEAGMLGVPAIYINPLDAGVLKNLSQSGILFNLSRSENLIDEIERLLNMDNLTNLVSEKSRELIDQLINPTAFFTWYFLNYPKSDQLIEQNPDYQFNFK